MEASHVGGFDNFGKCEKVGKISSISQMYASYPNIHKQAMKID